MKKKTVIILLVYIICSLTCVTFAWMSAPKSPSGQAAVLEFSDDENKSTLSVQARSISYSVYAYDDSLSQYIRVDNLDDIMTSTKFIPGQYVKVRLDFTNASSNIYTVKLQAVDVETSDEGLLEYIYFGINNTEGYNSDYYYTSPLGTYVRFSDYSSCINDKYQITLVDELQLTPTTDDNVISLYGYVLFNRLADSTYENMTFSLGHFRVIL